MYRIAIILFLAIPVFGQKVIVITNNQANTIRGREYRKDVFFNPVRMEITPGDTVWVISEEEQDAIENPEPGWRVLNAFKFIIPKVLIDFIPMKQPTIDELK